MEAAIRHVLPFQSENRWSDLLAALVATDPVPLLHLLGLDLDPLSLSVRREMKASDTDRHDIVLWSNNRARVVVEVKVLSGIGRAQLARYEESAPRADLYVILYPAGLVVDTNGSPRWRAITWESVLSAHVESSNRWVADTARAWLAHLDAELPKVDALTVWNRLRDGEGFVTAMKTRISWIFSNLQAPEPLEKRLVSSSAGNSAVVGLRVRALLDGYTLQAEIEERMGVRSIPKYASALKPPKGPSAWVGLVQSGVTTSADFDWAYLAKLWREVMETSRTDWVRNRARPRGIDKGFHETMVAAGGPRYLGVGFGDAQTRISRECMFGARIQFPGGITLGAITRELDSLGQLLLKMRDVPPDAGVVRQGERVVKEYP